MEIVGSSEHEVDEETKVAERLYREAVAEDTTAAHDADEQERLWEAHHASSASVVLNPEDHMVGGKPATTIAS
jgi:FAD/FMN-containing dehydrogenase